MANLGFKYKLGGPTKLKTGMGTFTAKDLSPKPAGPKPGLGAPAGSRPPAPKVVGQHMVPDSTYNAVIHHINLGEKQQLNQLGGQERQVKFNFGLEDPTNPFSRANALKQAFLAKYKGASTGLAAQGQLYSGAHERALARTRRQYDQDYADLRSAYDAALSTIGNQMTGVKFNSESDRIAAFQDWLARAPDAADIASTAPAAAPSAKASAAAPLMKAGATPKIIEKPSTTAASAPARSFSPVATPRNVRSFAAPVKPKSSGGNKASGTGKIKVRSRAKTKVRRAR